MKILLLNLSLLITHATLSQTETISGKAYRNAQFYADSNTFITSTFEFKLRNKKIDQAFQLKSIDEKVEHNELLYGIWIVDTDDFFYLNLFRYGYGFPKCFVKFHKRGNYYYFKARPQLSSSQEHRLTNSQMAFGLVGTGVTASNIAKENEGRWHNVFDLSKGTVNILSELYIKKILRDHPQLYQEYMNETERNSIETLKMYLEKVNAKNEL